MILRLIVRAICVLLQIHFGRELTGGNDSRLMMSHRPSEAVTKMMIRAVLLCLALWTGVCRTNSAIASFRLNISDIDLLRFMAPMEATDGSESCPNDDDTFSFADPGWPDQTNGTGGRSPVRQRYSQSNYLISSGELIRARESTCCSLYKRFNNFSLIKCTS